MTYREFADKLSPESMQALCNDAEARGMKIVDYMAAVLRVTRELRDEHPAGGEELYIAVLNTMDERFPPIKELPANQMTDERIEAR